MVVLAEEGMGCREDLGVDLRGHAGCLERGREVGEGLAAHCEGLILTTD